MDAITYTAVRANLARTMDRVCDNHEALIITRNGEQSVVMLSLDDYKALEEKEVRVAAPHGLDEAVKVVERSLAAYQERFGKKVARA